MPRSIRNRRFFSLLCSGLALSLLACSDGQGANGASSVTASAMAGSSVTNGEALSQAALPLPPLDMSGNAPWNWAAPFLASDWASPLGVLPWKFDHVTTSGSDVVLTMDASGAAQVQGQGATPAYSDGLWEADVTIPELRPGVDVAAFYLYENEMHHEIDFEFFGELGLMVTLHTDKGATDSIKIAEASEFSGKRLRLAMKVDQAEGSISMLVNGVERHRFDRKLAAVWPTLPMKPYFDLQPGAPAQDSWLGHWNGFSSPNDNMKLIVHGYSHT